MLMLLRLLTGNDPDAEADDEIDAVVAEYKESLNGSLPTSFLYKFQISETSSGLVVGLLRLVTRASI